MAREAVPGVKRFVYLGLKGISAGSKKKKVLAQIVKFLWLNNARNE